MESEARANEILRQMLPSCAPDGEVHGLPGLRIRQRPDQGIEAHQVGRETSVRLVGVPPAAWKRVESAILARIAELGWRPLWKHPGAWTDEEAAFEQRWNTGKWARHVKAGAWCSSGLLRRLAAFHTVAPADLVTGYRGYGGLGPVRWCLDLAYRAGVPQRRDRLMAALTDSEFGLPIAPARHLDKVYDHPMPHMIRLDDTARTDLVELRFAACDGRSFTEKPEHRDVGAGIRKRVDAILASG